MTSNFTQSMAHWQRLAPTERSVFGIKMLVQSSSHRIPWEKRSPSAASMLVAKYSRMPSVTIGQKATNTTIHRKRLTFSCVHVLTNLNLGKHNNSMKNVSSLYRSKIIQFLFVIYIMHQ